MAGNLARSRLLGGLQHRTGKLPRYRGNRLHVASEACPWKVAFQMRQA